MCRGARRSSSALVVQNDLPLYREWRESGPKHGVVVQHSAVDANDRRRSGDWWAGEDGEINPARPHSLTFETGRARQRAAKREEFGIRHEAAARGTGGNGEVGVVREEGYPRRQSRRQSPLSPEIRGRRFLHSSSTPNSISLCVSVFSSRVSPSLSELKRRSTEPWSRRFATKG